MDLSPKKRREILVQLLYLLEDSKEISLESAMSLMAVFRVNRRNMLSFYEEANKIFTYKDSLDEQLSSLSQEYSLERIAKVDLAILRVVLYELQHDLIPVEIAIAEALRVANKFSSFGAGKYLHAMIDSVFKQSKKIDAKAAL